MKYVDGADAHLGDRVRIANGDTGVVVFSIDTDEYSEDYPRADWSYLGSGVMVKTDAGALVHFNGSGEVLIEKLRPT